MTSIDIHDDVAPCPMCNRLTAVEALCECDSDEYGPLCGSCCRVWHQDERKAA